MKPIEGNPADAEKALRAVLQFMILEPHRQLALFPEPKNCCNCSVAIQHITLLERYGRAPFFRDLNAEQAGAVARVGETAGSVFRVPNHCHEPHLLSEEPFLTLRKHARAAMDLFGWAPANPDPAFLSGRPEYSALRQAEFDASKKKRLASRAKGPPADEFADIPQFDPRGLTVEEFRDRVDQVPWFSRLGKRHRLDRSVDRIKDWDEWGGPESDGNAPMAPESGRWEQALLALPKPGPEAIRTLWSSVEDQAKGRMPFAPEEDAWDGETNASWHGAWVAATIACCLLAGMPIPGNALRQWAWFARGHWPCSYSEDDDLARGKDDDVVQAALDQARLVVF